MRTSFILLVLSLSQAFAQVEPKTSEEFYTRAQQSFGQRQYERTIEDCSQTLSLDPEFQEALLLRATAYSKLRQPEKSIADLDVVLRMHPRAATFVTRGNEYMLLKRYDAAAADFSEAIERTPGSLAGYILRAYTRRMLGDIRGANEDQAMASQLASEAPSATRDEPVFKIGAGITVPKVIFQQTPEYVEEARKARIEGVVVLSLIVDSQGQARDFKVLVPLGYGLDEKAIEAVQHWKFRPAMKDGHPVAVHSTIEVTFKLL